MLDIVGGVYLEFCVYPPHRAFLGSGGRAALALGHISNQIRLHAWVEPKHLETLVFDLARTNVELRPTATESTPVFSYLHSLANPDIRGMPSDAAQRRIAIVGERILRFGMVDGSAIVQGQRVVYDPQAPDSPEPFSANGSTAEELAYVCNTTEALNLTGTKSVIEAGDALVHSNYVAAVIIKAGPRGSYWFSRSGRGWVPARYTETVFKIGSGDIFSAAFAHAWAERDLGVEEAARFASDAAAYYCRNRSLPLPSNFDRSEHQGLNTRSQSIAPNIYLAGPFFTISQRWLLEEARSIMLDMGASVFSPLHDVGKGPASKVAEKDLQGLKRCGAVLALLDGFDTGTVFEVGYARAIGKPVVAYADTPVPEQLTMLEGSGCEVVTDFGTAVYRSLWRALD